MAADLIAAGDIASEARFACSALRSAHASGSKTALVSALTVCGIIASVGPKQMAFAFAEEVEESQELGLTPTSQATPCRLDLACLQAAIAICEAALAAVGGRDSPAAADEHCVPSPLVEARARDGLQICLDGFTHQLFQRFKDLYNEAADAQMANTRIGRHAAVEKAKEAAAVADQIGGVEGAYLRADADILLTRSLLGSGEMAAAARAACSALRAARASGSRSTLIEGLTTCGAVASEAPEEMAEAERESREHERLSGSPCHGGLDLSQEGRISLPTSEIALSRLCITYMEATVVTCDAALAAAADAALAAADGRGSPAEDDPRGVPSLFIEARVRGNLGVSLFETGEDPARGLELHRQSVVLLRRVIPAASGAEVRAAKSALASNLLNMGAFLNSLGTQRYVQNVGVAPPGAPPLRFGIGERVQCYIGTWARGRVTQHWYTGAGVEGVAPYQVRVAGGAEYSRSTPPALPLKTTITIHPSVYSYVYM